MAVTLIKPVRRQLPPVTARAPLMARPNVASPDVVAPEAVTMEDDVVPAAARPRATWQVGRIIGAIALVAVAIFVLTTPDWGGLSDRVSDRLGLHSSWPTQAATGVPRWSNAQGAEDAPRSETPEGRRTDRERCMDTLRLRRVELQTARDTCNKMIAGIYHG